MKNKEISKTYRLEAEKSGQKRCLQAFNKLLILLNDFSRVPRTYKLSHINDNTDVIPKAESEKRVIWLICVLGFCLHLGLAIVISVLISLEQNQVLQEGIEMAKLVSDVLVVQKLAVIFGDGTTLFLAVNKSLELKVLKTHKFNYDNCGFFAYDEINHIQTLVGSSENLNYIHDSDFNSKKIQGKLLTILDEF